MLPSFSSSYTLSARTSLAASNSSIDSLFNILRISRSLYRAALATSLSLSSCTSIVTLASSDCVASSRASAAASVVDCSATSTCICSSVTVLAASSACALPLSCSSMPSIADTRCCNALLSITSSCVYCSSLVTVSSS